MASLEMMNMKKCVPAVCQSLLNWTAFAMGIGMSVPRSHCDSIVGFLSDPAFVGSAYIQESLPKGNPVGDDDKIYFFFSEAGKEFDFFDNTIVSRIARVCKVSDAPRQIVHLKQLSYPWVMCTPCCLYRILLKQEFACLFVLSTYTGMYSM